MNTRDEFLLALRPEIPTAKVSKHTSDAEQFQNLTLRPILKYQNELLVASFKKYIQRHKTVFEVLTVEQKLDYIENTIHKDTKFRNSLKGMIVGQFTLEEFSFYQENFTVIGKRIMFLIVNTLQDNVQLLEDEVLN